MEEYLKHCNPEVMVRLLDRLVRSMTVAAERESRCEAGLSDEIFEVISLRNAFAYECDDPKKLMIMFQS